MKKYILFILLISFISVLGCSTKPEDTIVNFYDELCKGNIAEAKGYLTKDTIARIDSLTNILNISTGGQVKKDFIFIKIYKECKKRGGFKDVKIDLKKVDNKTLKYNAKFIYRNNSTGIDKGYLIKTKDGWKIDFRF